MSPSLTYSLLKFEELKTERENHQQALEILQATQARDAAAAAVAAAAAAAGATGSSTAGAGAGGAAALPGTGVPATGKRNSKRNSSGVPVLPFQSDLGPHRMHSYPVLSATAAAAVTAAVATLDAPPAPAPLPALQLLTAPAGSPLLTQRELLRRSASFDRK
jgi:hypothetical protein